MKEWLKKNEYKLIVAIGLVIISSIAFEIGYLKGSGLNSETLVIEKVPENFQVACSTDPNQNVAGASTENEAQNSEETAASASSKEESEECNFIASKNSDKYHLPTCSYAKRIKEENKVCLSSKEEAESDGYQPAKCCIK